jgi:hypothetical protein
MKILFLEWMEMYMDLKMMMVDVGGGGGVWVSSEVTLISFPM